MIASPFFLQREGGPPRGGGPKVGEQVVMSSPLTGQSTTLTIVLHMAINFISTLWTAAKVEGVF